MKNIFRILMAVAVLFTASCAKEDISSSIGGGEANVTFTVDLPELGTRAYGNGTNATLLRYFVFDASNGAELEALRGTATTSTGKFTFTLPLLKGMEYNIALWADKNIGTEDEPKGYYQFDGRDVTVSYVNANDNDRDAFYHYEPNFDPTDPRTTSFQLYRPFAQLNAAVVDSDIVAVGKNEVELTTSTVKVTTYTKFNLATGDVDKASETEVTFNEADMPYEANETLKSGYTYLSMNYLLVPKAGMVSKVTFKFNNSKDINFGTSYDNVPLKQNYRTNILGALLTKPTEFNVTIDPAFGIPDIDEWKQVADGVVLMNNTYLITSLNGLKWFAKETDGVTRAGGNTFKGKTVQLGTDIDLNNEPWTPIASNGKFEGKFDGGNHTISNLKVKVEDRTPAGLFARASYVSNLKLENVSVEGHYKAGAVVGDGLCSRINNCHVKNAYIKITPLNEDDGNHAGGIVGYLSAESEAYVTNCSVTNANIIAYRDCGGIAGTTTGETCSPVVKNNTITNVEIVANQLDPYCDATKNANVGEVVGRNSKNIDLTDNSCDNVKTDVLKVVNDNVSIATATGLSCLARNIDEDDDAAAFEGQTIILTEDIDLSGIVFEPIGSYRFDKIFKGTFDGQGHTIKNLSQNTWELNNGYYYNDCGLGLFGAVQDGHIKNLTMDNANISGESALCGIVASVAENTTFENIVVKNSNCADYQYYSGGIVGWVSGDNNNFINCNVDASTTIGGQWGDFGNSNGGIIGGTAANATIYMKDCNVACRIDAVNDVVSAYRYYAYRCCGMLIGNTNNSQVINETPYAAAPNLTCENVTVTYGTWMNYHYCEFAGTGYPYVRVESGVSVDAYVNIRYGHPTDANGNTVVDHNHVHNDGEDHHICLPFDQLLGGGPNGDGRNPVYGLASFPGVTVVYPAKYTCDLCGQQHNVQ